MLQKFRKPEVTQRNVDQPKVCHVFPQRKSAPRTLKKPSGFAGGPESFLQTPAAKRSLFAKEQIDFEKSISGISRHAYARNLQDSYKKQEAVIPNCFSATAATRTKHLDIDNASGQRLDPRDKLGAQPEHQKTLSQVAHQHSENRGYEPSGIGLDKTSLAFEQNVHDSHKKQEAVIPNCFSAAAATRTKQLDYDNVSGQRLDPRDKVRAQPVDQKTFPQVAHQVWPLTQFLFCFLLK